MATPDNVPDMNHYVVSMFNSRGILIKSHTLDYSERTGFNPESTKTLATPDTSRPYLKPDGFGYKATQWNMNLIIPNEWIGTKAASDYFEVKVANAFGDGEVVHRWGSGQAW